ncbi:MAG: DUF5131 family protein [FCB group bacterium]|jgi:protein gp37|nr:DUF5131 family protein [FCB group bacterium]
MAEKTGIEWADSTWNPVVGCTRVNKGCEHCYAERLSGRLSGMGLSKYAGLTRADSGRWTGDVRLDERTLTGQLGRWKSGRRVFVCSMSDLFHEKVHKSWRVRVFEEMSRHRQHRYILLTKRFQRMAEFIYDVPYMEVFEEVWWGMTAFDQASYNTALGWLHQMPCNFRKWLSLEPLLGPIYARNNYLNVVRGVVVGGETGPGARRMHVEWVDQVYDQCAEAGVQFFFKRWSDGGVPAGESRCTYRGVLHQELF